MLDMKASGPVPLGPQLYFVLPNKYFINKASMRFYFFVCHQIWNYDLECVQLLG